MRIEEYRRPDGTWTRDTRAAIRVTAEQVRDAARAASSLIPAQYFVATADHESNLAINERDTEPNGYVSKGIFQIGDEEISQVHGWPCDPYTLGDAMRIFAALQEKRLLVLEQLVNGPASSIADPTHIWAYLSIAHNQGIEAAEQTIRRYGVDWVAYQSRNLTQAQTELAMAKRTGDKTLIDEATGKLAWWHKVFAYGNDCITGGWRWPGEA
jgi:hypothetical protein